MADDRKTNLVIALAAIPPIVAVFGASGLIGEAIATDLDREGFSVVAAARRYTNAQKAEFSANAVECPIVSLNSAALVHFLSERSVDIVVNCVGILQETRNEKATEIHRDFVARLLGAISELRRPVLLIHISIPGQPAQDRTMFSQTKREAEQLIAAGLSPYVILRPGFVVGPSAFGGSALIRSLAALPVCLPEVIAKRPFAAVAIADLGRTIAEISRRWQAGERRWAAIWDVMERKPKSVGCLIGAFRSRFGGPSSVVRLPYWMIRLGAGAGDLSAHLGWRPPIRSTALHEMRRGIEGDPNTWIQATGIEPMSLEEMLRDLPVGIQENWFSRLYLVKPIVVGSLAVFWIVSGLIPLLVSFDAATAAFQLSGLPPQSAQVSTVAASLVDVAVGTAIAFRKTCRTGLIAGIAIALGYLAGATMIAPDLWIEPLGSLVKTIPAIVLMVVALAMLPDRA